MRIAISNSRLTWGGGENWSLTAALGLAKRGHDVCLLTNPVSELCKRAREAGRDVGKLKVVPFKVRGTGDLIALASGTWFFRRNKIEIICANMEREVRTLGLSARMAGRIPFVRRRGSDYGFKNTWGNKTTFKHLVDGIIVNSDSTRKNVLATNPWIPAEKMGRIYNGIPSTFTRDDDLRARTRQQFGYEDHDVVVGIVGALAKRKGHEFLFEAAREVAQRRPEFRLLVAGGAADGKRAAAQADEIRAHARRLELESFTQFPGQVENPNAVYNAIDILAMPSTNEGFGYAAGEAMATETPVVVSDASSLPEVVGTAGRIVPARDVGALAEALDALVGDAAERSRLGRAGAQRVRDHFSIERMVAEIEIFFTGVVTGLDVLSLNAVEETHK